MEFKKWGYIMQDTFGTFLFSWKVFWYIYIYICIDMCIYAYHIVLYSVTISIIKGGVCCLQSVAEWVIPAAVHQCFHKCMGSNPAQGTWVSLGVLQLSSHFGNSLPSKSVALQTEVPLGGPVNELTFLSCLQLGKLLERKA